MHFSRVLTSFFFVFFALRNQINIQVWHILSHSVLFFPVCSHNHNLPFFQQWSANNFCFICPFFCRYVIKAGDYDREANETSEQEMVPERIFVHQKYKHESSVDADIALVKLPTKVKLNRFVRTVCLPENYEGDLAIPGTKGVVAGWGVTRALRHGEYVKPDDTSNVLRHAFFTIQENNICRKKSSILYNSTLAFCAGDRKGVKDSCRGDSGGAFVREVKRRRNLHWVAVGIVSWGEGCAQTENYGYYTRLYPFIDWIKKTKNKRKYNNTF